MDEPAKMCGTGAILPGLPHPSPQAGLHRTCSMVTGCTVTVKPMSAGPISLCLTVSLTGSWRGALMLLVMMVLRHTVMPEKHEMGGVFW